VTGCAHGQSRSRGVQNPSDYARLTAASARRLGLDVVLCLHPGGGTGNLTLDAIFSAEIVWDGDPEAEAAVREHAVVLPYGGSSVLGVHPGAVEDPHATVAGFTEGGELRIDLDQLGPGYEQLTPAAIRAIEDAGRTEGIVLEPVYTAKAMAGLVAAVARGEIRPGEKTVFVHTGGLAGLFGHPYAAAVASQQSS
jgi:L-cysteate sulfo-lyase